MRLYGLTLSFLLPSLVLYAPHSAIASPSVITSPVRSVRNPDSAVRVHPPDSFLSLLYTRDGGDEHTHGHAHGHGNPSPLVELNETDVLLYHAETPPSYWSIDIDNHNSGGTRHPGLMGLHALFMALAFFGALPAGIALRSVNHPWHGFSILLFWTFIVLGVAASALYRKLTPNMYEGQMHCFHGYLVILLAFTLSTIDLFAGASRLFARNLSIRSFWNFVIIGQEDGHPLGINSAEYASLVVEELEESDETFKTVAHHSRPVVATTIDDRNTHHDDTVQWVNKVSRHSEDLPETPASDHTLVGHRFTRGSQNSDDTLQLQSHLAKDIPLSRRIGQVLFATLERSLVFAGFAQVMHGVVIYTGGCRENYLNGCLAHLIKGGIFWCYGLVTFARFLGSFSDYGWAWNRAPAGHHVSAEFVESFVIFIYGITNTWMERFGAHPGDPYTNKQIQHIGIAIMFWFAGLVGMGLESRRLRRWLAAVSTASLKASNKNSDAVAEPASYGSSFNPFPALVIGVTGVAMSAHFQMYLFQVQIHALWGFCLTGFAFLRCLTYFFVWLSPPRSILPSRPPSEALSSFFLSCGGLIFIMSDEEITFAAMRRGYDDVMMSLNVAVAVTCFAFCWTMLVVGFKGRLISRTHSAVSFHQSA
ncbi:hypothetical protein B0F90DRAFT_1665300 [Multifurca ochricompacta]|uniref:Cytoplasmic protein n=1 Tax=Multifurca ochricompacta TaxID=376703 RepID=A0AAD4QSK2_9AGAM|nr:hypothetical protein B0F90DRAFT_1665300 [Multifurca ochricompacta]